MATHRLHSRDDIGAELRVPIKDQEALRLLAAFPSFVQLVRSRNSIGLKRRGLQPRLASSDCLLRPLDKAYNPASP